MEDEKCNLYERYVVGKLSAEDYRVAIAGLTQEIEDLCHTHIVMAAKAKKLSAKRAGGKAMREAAEALKGKRMLTGEIVASLIDKVRVFPDGEIAVDWSVSDLNEAIG